jgi:hypothetical protein
MLESGVPRNRLIRLAASVRVLLVAGITQNANLDNSDARRDLGYAPVGVSEGLQRCYPLPMSVPASAAVGVSG